MACFLPSGCEFYCVLAGSRYKFDKRPGLSPGRQCWKKALAQHRGTNYLGGRNLSWCRMFIVCSCASPGAGLSTGPGK
jgi:hypothetical protein